MESTAPPLGGAAAEGGNPMSEHRSTAEARSSWKAQRPRSAGRPPKAATR